jgi:hypothetical protein
MKIPSRYALASALLAVSFSLGISSTTQAAESWIFRRSYYSHEPVQAVQIGPPTNYKSGAYRTRDQGAYVQSGLRNYRSYIRVNGQVFDHVRVWESWVKSGRQF